MKFLKVALAILHLSLLNMGAFALHYQEPTKEAEGKKLTQYFPNAARVLSSSGEKCSSGTLIDNRWVITSARTKNITKVIIGEKVYSVIARETHPGFKAHGGASIEYDVQLLYLNRPVTHIAPVKRYYGREELGKFCWITGFGDTNTSRKEELHVGTNLIELDRKVDTATPGYTTQQYLSKWRTDEGFKNYPVMLMRFPAVNAATKYHATNRPGDGGGGVYINIKNSESTEPPTSQEDFLDQMRLVGISYFNPVFTGPFSTAFARLSEPQTNNWINKIILEYTLREKPILGEVRQDIIKPIDLKIQSLTASQFLNVPDGGMLIDSDWLLDGNRSKDKILDKYIIGSKEYEVDKKNIYYRWGLTLVHLKTPVTTQKPIERERNNEAEFFESLYTQNDYENPLDLNATGFIFKKTPEGPNYNLLGVPHGVRNSQLNRLEKSINVLTKDKNSWIDDIILKVALYGGILPKTVEGSNSVVTPNITPISPSDPIINPEPVANTEPVVVPDKTWNLIIYFHDRSDGAQMFKIIGELKERLINKNVRAIIHYRRDAQTRGDLNPNPIPGVLKNYIGTREWVISNDGTSTKIEEFKVTREGLLPVGMFMQEDAIELNDFLNRVHHQFPTGENFLMVGDWNSKEGSSSNGGWKQIIDGLSTEDLSAIIGAKKYNVFFTNAQFAQCIENAYRYKENFDYFVAPQHITHLVEPHTTFLTEFLSNLCLDTNKEASEIITEVFKQTPGWGKTQNNVKNLQFILSLVKTKGVESLCTKLGLLANQIQSLDVPYNSELNKLKGYAQIAQQGQVFDAYILINKLFEFVKDHKDKKIDVSALVGNLKDDIISSVQGLSPDLELNNYNGISIFIPRRYENLEMKYYKGMGEKTLQDRYNEDYIEDYCQQPFANEYGLKSILPKLKVTQFKINKEVNLEANEEFPDNIPYY